MFLEKESTYLNWYPQWDKQVCSGTFGYKGRICYFRITISTFELGQSYITDLMCMTTSGPHVSFDYLGNFSSLENAKESSESHYQLRLRNK